MEPHTDLLRGTLDLLILKALSLEPIHGVGISRRITQVTRGALQVSFGSLFPSLHRTEEKGWVEAEWRMSENKRRATYHRISRPGRAQLQAEGKDWNRVVRVMTAAIQSAQTPSEGYHARTHAQHIPESLAPGYGGAGLGR